MVLWEGPKWMIYNYIRCFFANIEGLRARDHQLIRALRKFKTVLQLIKRFDLMAQSYGRAEFVKPGMVECILSGNALLWIEIHEFTDEILALFGDVVP